MQVEYRENGRVAVLRPTGVLNAAVIDQVREEWFSWWQGSEPVHDVVLDLRQVSFLDSSGLGLLIALLKRVAQRGGDLKLAGLQGGVRVVFEITRTSKVFAIFDTVEEAVRSIA